MVSVLAEPSPCTRTNSSYGNARAGRTPAFQAVRVAVANPEGDPLADLADLMLEGPDEVPGVLRRLLR